MHLHHLAPSAGSSLIKPCLDILVIISPFPTVEKDPYICSLFSNSLPYSPSSLRRLPSIKLAITIMPPFYELAVASFAQPSPLKSKWAIAVIFSQSSPHSLIYHIVGSPSDYSLDAPQSVSLKEGENGYMRKTPVGSVDSERLHQLHSTLASIPVVCGNPAWNSHNWVMDGILALRKLEGFHIDKNVTSQLVAERLGET